MQKQTLKQPQKLPFLEAICWDLRNVYALTQDEMLNRYERGWDYKGVLEDLSAQEKEFVAQLAQDKGSWLCANV